MHSIGVLNAVVLSALVHALIALVVALVAVVALEVALVAVSLFWTRTVWGLVDINRPLTIIAVENLRFCIKEVDFTRTAIFASVSSVRVSGIFCSSSTFHSFS